MQMLGKEGSGYVRSHMLYKASQPLKSQNYFWQIPHGLWNIIEK